MLLKGYEDSASTYQNINQHLKLIAAREIIQMNLEDYLARLRYELANNQLKENELIITGRKLRQPLTKEEIDTGIKIGLNLIKQREAATQQTERSK